MDIMQLLTSVFGTQNHAALGMILIDMDAALDAVRMVEADPACIDGTALPRNINVDRCITAAPKGQRTAVATGWPSCP